MQTVCTVNWVTGRHKQQTPQHHTFDDLDVESSLLTESVQIDSLTLCDLSPRDFISIDVICIHYYFDDILDSRLEKIIQLFFPV